MENADERASPILYENELSRFWNTTSWVSVEDSNVWSKQKVSSVMTFQWKPSHVLPERYPQLLVKVKAEDGVRQCLNQLFIFFGGETEVCWHSP